ncbi:hypothetical protein Kpol_1048p51 [Vanderwaltozyma polyspora DSM 70294]|uniref:Protein transport protein sec16 n=1 Tax=Vanderwaltozyma polyspora (strain ATCC 22028 / DSM 70294 / BCRC 21397 / CBS 2163 / NBRC 10782 / NRRL Y-8283 / UCD 57-17) TaxID=436907 RepID=A7TGL3_VANPO|nr:uncharacterized protein Kpol_1048p51 [Vanderwaltozyma polyspora DSM 70294]EDO18620.1 hypothetical protein Kpol_1048p51 [Vanderwaltozyma polyspora DSM 70294]
MTPEAKKRKNQKKKQKLKQKKAVLKGQPDVNANISVEESISDNSQVLNNEGDITEVPHTEYPEIINQQHDPVDVVDVGEGANPTPVSEELQMNNELDSSAPVIQQPVSVSTLLEMSSEDVSMMNVEPVSIDVPKPILNIIEGDSLQHVRTEFIEEIQVFDSITDNVDIHKNDTVYEQVPVAVETTNINEHIIDHTQELEYTSNSEITEVAVQSDDNRNLTDPTLKKNTETGTDNNLTSEATKELEQLISISEDELISDNAESAEVAQEEFIDNNGQHILSDNQELQDISEDINPIEVESQDINFIEERAELVPSQKEEEEVLTQKSLPEELGETKSHLIEDEMLVGSDTEDSNTMHSDEQFFTNLTQHNQENYEPSENFVPNTSSDGFLDDVPQQSINNETIVFEKQDTMEATNIKDDDDISNNINYPKIDENIDLKEIGAETEEKKFSFLEDDDDLLEDEDLLETDNMSGQYNEINLSQKDNDQTIKLDSDDDSFLDSDEEFEMNLSKSLDNSSIKVSQSQEEKNDSQRVSISGTSSKNTKPTSKYDPTLVPQPIPQQSTFPATSKMTTMASTRSATSSTGIVPPQPFQQNISNGKPNSDANQKVAEKLNKEKQKSDAYDFPIDLVPKNLEKVHAKPVPIPKSTFNANQNYAIPVQRRMSAFGQPKEQGIGNKNFSPINDIASNPLSLPKNPYASVPISQSSSTNSNSVPPQASIVLPNSMLRKPSLTYGTQSQPPIIDSSLGSYGKPISPLNAPTNTRLGNVSSQYAPQISGNTGPHGEPLGPMRYNRPNSISPQTNQQAMNQQTIQRLSEQPSIQNNINSNKPGLNSTTGKYSHNRTGSHTYTPMQASGSKYAPNKTMQLQNSMDQSAPLLSSNPAMSGIVPPTNSNKRPAKTSGVGRSNTPYAHNSNEQTVPIDNEALLNKQFPIISWRSSNKITYAVPSIASQSPFAVSNAAEVSDVSVSNYNTICKPSEVLRTFPGPLIKGRTKNNDILKWIEEVLNNRYINATSLDTKIFEILKLKLSENTTLKDIASLLYSTDDLMSVLSHGSSQETKSQFNAYRLDPNSRTRILAYLQTGEHDDALKLALDQKDYAMSLLVGSMIGKDKWAEVIQRYISDEFVESNNSSKNAGNLLYLIFQVFVGNAKTAVKELYLDNNKGLWAINNWHMIVAAILNNVKPQTIPGSTSKHIEVPPLVFEFLVEFGIFLEQKSLHLPACIIFIIANVPLSSKPIVQDSPVLFSSVGNPSTPCGMMWSEIYDFNFCKDPKAKYNIDLLPIKLYHAYCLFEQDLIPLCSKYTDHISHILKSSSKKDPLCINISARLSELSTRMMNSSNSWLGKPKLSSVWDQLDKSFNKFIGGDDDSLIPATGEKKLFDGFTPVTSRNSSMLDITQTHSQAQFTPYQNSVHRTSQTQLESLSSSEKTNMISPVRPSSLLNEQYKGTNNGNPYLPPKFDSKLLHSPHSFTPVVPFASGNPNQLRRVRTEQYMPTHSSSISETHGSPSSKSISRDSRTALKNAPLYDIISEASEKDHSVNELRKTVSLTQPYESDDNQHMQQSLPKAPILDRGSDLITTNKEELGLESEENLIAGVDKNELKDKIEEVDNSTTHEQNQDNAFNYSNESGEDRSELIENYKESSVETINQNPTIQQNGMNKEVEENMEVFESQSNGLITPSIISSANPITFEGNSLQGLAIKSQTSLDNIKSKYNPYEGIKSYQPSNISSPEIGGQVSSISGNGVSTDSLGVNNFGNVKVGYTKNISSADAILTIDKNDSALNIPSRRFGPIKESEPLSKALFDPIIKVSSSSNFRSVSSISPSAMEHQYDDIIEDESEDEDEILERQKEEERKREEAERERRLQEQEKERERKRAELEKQKKRDTNTDNGSNQSGWFGWLKKDPNEKKPIKAKLGHKKTNFYYDEKLKRWVNKTSTEEEKQDMSAPPPPPPVVKRKNTEPASKPRSGSTNSINANIGERTSIVASMGNQSPSPATLVPPSLITSDPPSRTPSVNSSGINLSGKKANGLDDLLSLTGSGPAVNTRRKKRTGRGYVNVMDNN